MVQKKKKVANSKSLVQQHLNFLSQVSGTGNHFPVLLFIMRKCCKRDEIHNIQVPKAWSPSLEVRTNHTSTATTHNLDFSCLSTRSQPLGYPSLTHYMNSNYLSFAINHLTITFPVLISIQLGTEF